MPHLRMSSGGGVAAYRVMALPLWYDRLWGGFRPLYRGRFLRSLATRYVGRSIKRLKSGRALQTMLTDTPKYLVGRLCETDCASLTKYCLTWPVMWMAPEPRHTPERTSWALPVHPSYGTRVTWTLWTYGTASTVLSIKSYFSLEQRPQITVTVSNGSWMKDHMPRKQPET